MGYQPSIRKSNIATKPHADRILPVKTQQQAGLEEASLEGGCTTMLDFTFSSILYFIFGSMLDFKFNSILDFAVT